MQNRNFPYILLGRALYLVKNLASRSHARRDPLALTTDNRFKEEWLDEERQKRLEKYHKAFGSDKEIDREALEGYSQLLQETIESII